MKDILESLVQGAQGYLELRYHKRNRSTYMAQKGRLDVANTGCSAGVGVRALVDGAWGFAATADLTKTAIQKAIGEAQKNAALLAKHAGGRKVELADADLYKGDFTGPGFQELLTMARRDKMAHVIDQERALASASPMVGVAKCRYNEILDEKVIVTSDGASASMRLALPELSLSAIAEDRGEQISAGKGAGVSGGWSCLFHHPSLENLVEDTAHLAVDLLNSSYAEGGRKTCILAPAVVGLLCHEAVGHTVEADFVKAGSVAKDRIGTRVASDLVSMADSGVETLAGYAVGNLPCDDEGVPTETTVIIKDGILKSYLHNRETAKEFGVKPTGSSRAWLFNDEPLIRMRNTYLMPGVSKLADMIAETEDGYLVEGAGSGQADANGEFMFGCGHIWRIENGKKTKLLREATLSGIAFDVLQTVDRVSEEFLWDLGTGYCGKGQPAKVDAGGPYIRCQINVGGRS